MIFVVVFFLFYTVMKLICVFKLDTYHISVLCKKGVIVREWH